MVFSKDKAPTKLSGRKGIKLLSSPKTVERIGFGLFHNEIKLERLLNDQTRLYNTIIFIKHSLRSWWCFCTSEREGEGQAATGFTAQKNRQLRRLDQTMVVLETSNVRLDKHDVE